MAETLTSDVKWVNEIHEIRNKYIHVSAYLIENEEDYTLIDSGSQLYFDSMKIQIDAEIGDNSLSSLILSHADLPHAGNVEALREDHDGLDVILSSSRPDVVGLSEVLKCDLGSDMVIDGRTFSFLYPPLADIASSTWIFDHESGVLFTADGFGSFFEDSALSDDVYSDSVSVENIEEYYTDELSWLRYANPEKIADHIDDILTDYDISWIAPTHGHPIPENAINDYLDKLSEALHSISNRKKTHL